MTHRVVRKFALLLLAVSTLAAAASAQSMHMVKVSVPFEFSVGAKILPPGQYILLQPGQHLLVVRNARGQTVAQTLTQGSDTQVADRFPKLRFELENGKYKLAEVRQPDSSSERLFPLAKSDTRLARQHPTHGEDRVQVGP